MRTHELELPSRMSNLRNLMTAETLGWDNPVFVSHRAFRTMRQAGQTALDAGVIKSSWNHVRFFQETCYTRTGKAFTGYRIIKPEGI